MTAPKVQALVDAVLKLSDLITDYNGTCPLPRVDRDRLVRLAKAVGEKPK
jgi:hypothetical protein